MSKTFGRFDQKGEQMAFVDGDDTTGSISLTLFPTVFRQLRQSVEKGQVYYVEGKVNAVRTIKNCKYWFNE